MKTQQEYLDTIFRFFDAGFGNAYRKIRHKGKNVLLRNIISFYRRWFFSAFLEDSIITPGNLLENLHREEGFTGSSLTFPVPRSILRYGAMDYQKIHYTMESHPVVADLMVFLESCSPAVALDQDNILPPSHQDELMLSLTIPDPYYVDYLTQLAFDLKLLRKITSIYANQAQITGEHQAFFQLPPAEILRRIVNATSQTAAERVNEILPSKRFINREFILGILARPVTTDELFQHVYASLGLSLDRLIDFNPEDMLDEMYNAIVSSTFFLGVVLDKYLFAPLGFYLRFINPGYLLPCDLEKEMRYTLESAAESQDLSAAMFSPCSHYTLTALGEEFFAGTNTAIPFTSPFAFHTDLNFITIMESLARAWESGVKDQAAIRQFFIENRMYQNPVDVYDLKIRLKKKRAIGRTWNSWKRPLCTICTWKFATSSISTSR